MITVEEGRRIRYAACRMDEATRERASGDNGAIDEWQAAHNEFIDALDAVTDWSSSTRAG